MGLGFMFLKVYGSVACCFDGLWNRSISKNIHVNFALILHRFGVDSEVIFRLKVALGVDVGSILGSFVDPKSPREGSGTHPGSQVSQIGRL